MIRRFVISVIGAAVWACGVPTDVSAQQDENAAAARVLSAEAVVTISKGNRKKVLDFNDIAGSE